MNNEISQHISKLKNQPTTTELSQTLSQLHQIPNISDVQQLEVASALINLIIPESGYVILDQSIRHNLCELMCNRVGISQLVLTIKSDPTKVVFSLVLSDIVQQTRYMFVRSLLFACLNESSKLKRINQGKFRDIRGLITQKIPDCLNACFLETNDQRLDYVTTHYDSIVVSQLTELIKNIEFDRGSDTPSEFDELVLQVFLQFMNNNVKNLDILFDDKDLLLNLSQYKKLGTDKRFWQSMIRYLSGYGSSGTNIQESTFTAYRKVIEMFTIKEWDNALSQCAECGNPEVMKLFIQNAPKDLVFQQLKSTIKKFGVKSYQSQTSVTAQQDFAKYIALLIHCSNASDLKELSSDAGFLDAMTNRLESTLPSCRFLGMLIGDLVHQRIDSQGKPMFNITDHRTKVNKFVKALGNLKIPNLDTITIEDALQTISESKKSVITINQDVIELPNLKSTAIARTPVQTMLDLDPEDSDDEDPSNGRKKQVATPVYLKEMLAYMQATPKDDNLAFEKRQMAHMIAAQLIRIKKGSRELHFYSDSILECVLSMTSIGESPIELSGASKEEVETEYESWRLSVLVATTTGDFKSCFTWLLKTFVGGDISMSNRMKIITCLTLSCRELSGMGQDDDFVGGKNRIEGLGPQLLPGRIHEQFLEYESEDNGLLKMLESAGGSNNATDGAETDLMKRIHSLGLDGPGGGKVTRVSANLKNKAQNQKRKTRDISFINKQLPELYFSLTSLWRTITETSKGSHYGFQLGGYSSLLTSHFLQNLALVLQCGVPSCTELVEMGNEMLLISVDCLRHLSLDFQNDVFDSVLSCIGVLFCEIDANVVKLFAGYDSLLAVYNLLGGIIKMGVVVDNNSIKRCMVVAERVKALIG
ncbi:unnamed protein product [Ambrosiozyma monospora]|uniref:Unnamed protein product n=1 Tax=Ambrosiozyma monospora TaxID=43982 RepID=A0ACB5SXG4_AMBMO|nr:unnamed protein product [Ambrosiozyma monospora]